MTGRLPRLAATAMLVLAAADLTAAEVERPLIEFGLAGGGGWFPDYPAASQNHPQGIVLPFLLYRGEIFRSDESGVRGRFLRGDRVQLDLSVGGAVPADSDDNRAREGMPDLDLMGEIGPNLRFILFRSAGVSRLDLDLGLRAAFTTDFSGIEYQGLVFEPELSFKRLDVGAMGSRIRLGLGPIFADAGYMDYFYEVKPRDVRGGRPAYAADAGYLGARVQGSYRVPVGERLSVVAGARAEGYWGATNDDSPLHKRDMNLAVVGGFSYSFYQSAAQAKVTQDDPLD